MSAVLYGATTLAVIGTGVTVFVVKPPGGGSGGGPGIDGIASWNMHTILAGASGAGFPDGADGVQACDFDGDGLQDFIVGHEQGLRVTLSFNPGPAGNLVELPWPTVTLGGPGTTMGSVEDATCGDVDGDGALDILAASETGAARVTVLFGPTPPNTRGRLMNSLNWTRVDLTASAANRSMRGQVVNIAGTSAPELVVGGKESSGPDVAASLGYYSSATPRTGSSWTYTSLIPVGWVMQMYVLDFNADGFIDIVYSDRDPINVPALDNSKRGIHWLQGDGASTPAFIDHMIVGPESLHKWFTLFDWDSDGDYDLTDCASDTATISSQILINGGGGLTWTSIPVTQPANIGACQHFVPEDIDKDGFVDATFSYSNATAKTSVAWLKRAGLAISPSFTRGEISGILDVDTDVKMDNLLWIDVDGDTDKDAIVTEQHTPAGIGPGLGLIYFENPLINFLAPALPPGIICTQLTTGGSGVAGTSFVTPVVTPTANSLIVFAFQGALSTGSLAPTSVTGNGFTYTQIATLQYHTTNARRITLYRALGAAPTSGAITTTLSSSHTSAAWSVIECSGVDTSGTNGSSAFVQSATSIVTPGTTMTATLAALGDVDNVALAFVGLNGSLSVVPDDDFAELGDTSITPGNSTLESQWAKNQTTVTPTFTSANAGQIVIEVKATP